MTDLDLFCEAIEESFAAEDKKPPVLAIDLDQTCFKTEQSFVDQTPFVASPTSPTRQRPLHVLKKLILNFSMVTISEVLRVKKPK